MMRIALLVLLTLSLTACDALKDRMGIKDPAKVEAEAKAIGASCRLSGRGLEDCYDLNVSYPRAPIYAGWKEMNEYMAERKMEEQPPKSDQNDGKHMDSEPAKDMGKSSDKDAKAEPSAKDEAGKSVIKDIRPKKPDISKEVTKH